MDFLQLQLISLAIMIPVTLYTELRDGKIYNWLTVPAIVVGLLIGLLMGEFNFYLWGMLVGGGIFFIPYLISGLSRGRPVIGGGDVKFAAAVGALMGWPFALGVSYYAVFIGFAIGLAQIGWNLVKKTRTGKVERQTGDGAEAEADSAPKAPVSVWFTRIPFGTALCAGVIINLIEPKI